MSILNKAMTTWAERYEVFEIVRFLGMIEGCKGMDVVDMKGLPQRGFQDSTPLTAESITLPRSSTLSAPVAAIPFSWNRPASPSWVSRTAPQFALALGGTLLRAIDVRINLRQLPFDDTATYLAGDFPSRSSSWARGRGGTFPATVFAMGMCPIVGELFPTKLASHHLFVHVNIIPRIRGFVNHTGRQP